MTLSSQGGGWGAKTGLIPVARKGTDFVASEDRAKCLDANYWKGLDAHQARTGVLAGTRIRRLTPTECMRLMSWPDDWCDFGDYGNGPEPISDTQKYKMAGNGVVSKVVEEVVKHLIQPLDRRS